MCDDDFLPQFSISQQNATKRTLVIHDMDILIRQFIEANADVCKDQCNMQCSRDDVLNAQKGLSKL